MHVKMWATMARTDNSNSVSAFTRLVVSVLVGLLTAASVSLLVKWKYAPLAGWNAAALIYVVWAWLIVGNMNASQTKIHAVKEDPSRATADLLLIGASLASLVGVGILIVQADGASGLAKIAEISLSLGSVVISWIVVQIVHTLKYARLYYQDNEGGIDFNQTAAPSYRDFAYLSFTLGMTYQVSDTDIKTSKIRATALKHSLLSYVFGTVIIATTISTIAGLGK